jgi:hypothetical protein
MDPAPGVVYVSVGGNRLFGHSTLVIWAKMTIAVTFLFTASLTVDQQGGEIVKVRHALLMSWC